MANELTLQNAIAKIALAKAEKAKKERAIKILDPLKTAKTGSSEHQLWQEIEQLETEIYSLENGTVIPMDIEAAKTALKPKENQPVKGDKK